MIEPIADHIFKSATSVTLVIHGVGDHTPIDIVAEAKAGFEQADLPAVASYCTVPY